MDSARRPAEDLWRRTLAQIPSSYGRIVYLASLRDVNTGKYVHHGLSLLFGEQAADQALRDSHGIVFREWLQMALEQQKADLDLYFSSLPADRKTLAENWLRLHPYRNLVPVWASHTERELFDCNLELMLNLLRREYAA
ncbi:MAG: hypothetical protein HY821_08250 [Acidobacteria bacterium]|nr:hypothetical protein [Acidobacteriota bacterium]